MKRFYQIATCCGKGFARWRFADREFVQDQPCPVCQQPLLWFDRTLTQASSAVAEATLIVLAELPEPFDFKTVNEALRRRWPVLERRISDNNTTNLLRNWAEKGWLARAVHGCLNKKSKYVRTELFASRTEKPAAPSLPPAAEADPGPPMSALEKRYRAFRDSLDIKVPNIFPGHGGHIGEDEPELPQPRIPGSKNFY